MNELGSFASTIFRRTYAFDENETWEGCAARVAKEIANGDSELETQFFEIISTRKFIPGGRYLAQSGRDIKQFNNCLLLRAEDSREGWGDLLNKHVLGLSTGGGVGTYYEDIRERGRPIGRFGGVASGSVSLMSMVNEVARHVMAGGKRRSALWAGLPWWHPDMAEFLRVKNWSTQIRAMKEQDFNFPAPLDMTNISVCLDDAFFRRIKKDKATQDLYYNICKLMCRTGEPGFSVNLGSAKDDVLRNPCCEVTSADSNDVCNLGSINLSRIENLTELEKVTRIAVRFLYNGTFLSWLPHEDFYNVRKKNRRIGLGLMGLHEWCINNNQRYEPSGKLGKWLHVWQETSDDEAKLYSDKKNDVKPIAVRAIAPTGTIGIIAGTSTGIEPIFCVSYKRRFLDSDGKWKFRYVIDPTAEKLIQKGVDPTTIEDSISLAKNVEKRIAMQAYVQEFVDMAISSTINMPEWGEYGNSNVKKFSETLLKYLPKLRGITVYPDGSRPGQPIVSVDYELAKGKNDVTFEESDERCSGGVCGV